MQLDAVNNSQPGSPPVQVNPSNENESAKVSEVANKALSNGQESEAVLSKKKLEDKTSRLWNCKGTIKNPGGGSLYTFVMHPGFDRNHSDYSEETESQVMQILHELNPAVEPTTDLLSLLDFSKLNNNSDIRQLGYRIEKNSEGLWEITLPSRKALLKNWKKLQETNPNLPDFKICAANGIADHLSFVKAYMDNDVLLSKNKEFIHDQMIHVLPTIQFILGEQENYPDKKKILVDNINTYFKRINSINENSLGLDHNHSLTREQVELLEITLGLITDGASARSNFKDSKELTEMYMKAPKIPDWDSLVLKNTEIGQLSRDGKLNGTLADNFNEAWYKATMATAPIFGYPQISDVDVDGYLKNNPDQFLITDKAICTLFVIEGKEKLIEIPYDLTEKENENGYKLVVNFNNMKIEKELENRLIPEDIILDLKEMFNKEVDKETNKLSIIKKEFKQIPEEYSEIPPELSQLEGKAEWVFERDGNEACIYQYFPYRMILDFHPDVEDLKAGYHYSLYADSGCCTIKDFIAAENIHSFLEKLKELPESQQSRARLFSEKFRTKPLSHQSASSGPVVEQLDEK